MLLEAEKAFEKIQHPFMTKQAKRQTNITQHTNIIREIPQLEQRHLQRMHGYHHT